MVLYALIPIISGIIGWFTNWVAIRLFFWPREPVQVPLSGWQVQGLLPKRRAELASRLGEVIERELIDAQDLVTQLDTPEIRDTLTRSILAAVERRVHNQLPPFVPPGIKEAIIRYLHRAVREEMRHFFDASLPDLAGEMGSQVDVAGLVEERINSFDLDRLEELVNSIASRELVFIQLVGGVVGLVIGLVQVLMLAVFGTA